MHERQRAITSHNSRRKVICAGRRGGKTTLVARYAVKMFLSGHRVIYGTPVAKQLKQYWGKVKKHLKPLIESGVIYKNETNKYLKWASDKDSDGGATISAQTAYDAATWRGDWGDILIFDEYAFMNPDVWDVVGAPMMLDTNGEAWFVSTPNRKNHFHNLYVRGLEEDGRYKSFRFPSHDNPYLSKEALEEITQDMTEDNYKQEILAQFLDNEGAVFRNIAACINAPVTTPEDHWEWGVDEKTGEDVKKWHHLVCGIDWGKHNDYTVISVGCRDCMTEVHMDRFNKIDYAYQRQRLKVIIDNWSINNGLAETNAMGEPNLEMLQREGLPITGFTTTAQSKPQMIESLRLTLEKEQMQFLNIPIATAELEAYEMTVNSMGRPSYSAPTGVHDDTVIARALMNRAVTSYMPAFL